MRAHTHEYDKNMRKLIATSTTVTRMPTHLSLLDHIQQVGAPHPHQTLWLAMAMSGGPNVSLSKACETSRASRCRQAASLASNQTVRGGGKPACNPFRREPTWRRYLEAQSAERLLVCARHICAQVARRRSGHVTCARLRCSMRAG